MEPAKKKNWNADERSNVRLLVVIPACPAAWKQTDETLSICLAA